MKSTHFTIELNGESFVLKPLPLKVMETLGKRFLRRRDPGASPHGEELELAIDIAHQSLRQSHPSIERRFVADMLDLQSLAVVVRAMEHWKVTAQQSRGARRRGH